MNDELFLSIDIETLGPIPGKHPMVELGVAAFNLKGTIVSTWRSNIARGKWECDTATMKWWHQPENYTNLLKTQENAQSPKNAMLAFSAWLGRLSEGTDLVPVAYPAAFDYMFVYWYLMYYVGHSQPLSFSCLDLKSYVCGSRQKRYRKTTKRSFPKAWFHPKLKHTHGALDDAIEQGWIFIQAHRDNLGLALLQVEDLQIIG